MSRQLWLFARRKQMPSIWSWANSKECNNSEEEQKALHIYTVNQFQGKTWFFSTVLLFIWAGFPNELT